MAPASSSVPVIMQVLPALGAGGAEQGCIDIAAALVKAGAKAIVVAHGGARLPELARTGALYIELPVHSKNPLVMFRNVRRLRALIQEHKVDIVHARSRAPAWSCLEACRGTKARFMTTCHAPYNIANMPKKFYNSSIARGERIIAISHYVADYIEKNYRVEPSRIRTIPRGIDLGKFHPGSVTPERMIRLSREWRLPDGAPVIMMPGRLTRWKGHEVLIDAMAQLNRPDVFCMLLGSAAGKEEYRTELEEKIRLRGLEGSIRIVDHCTDMAAAYMLATIVVSASTDPEGFGRIAVEAQAMGRPCVATDHGGSRETIRRGETGWLVRPGDADSLSQAIAEALALDPLQRAVLGTRAMAHVAQHFTKETMAAATLGVYDELLPAPFFMTAGLVRTAQAAE
jgi:glycosyltransferase involved in cell wall biosynthesis